MHFERALGGERQWAINTVKFLSRDRGRIVAVLPAHSRQRFVFSFLISPIFLFWLGGDESQRRRVDRGRSGRRCGGGGENGGWRERDRSELKLIGVVDLNGIVSDVGGNNISDADDVKSPDARIDVHSDGVDVGRDAERRGANGGSGREDGSILSLYSPTLESGGAGRTAVTAAVIAGG